MTDRLELGDVRPSADGIAASVVTSRRSVVIGAASALTVGLGASAAQAADGGDVTVRQAGSPPPAAADAAHFTGRAQVLSPFQGTPPARITGATVAFDPGARTAWHSHPLGQTLIVTAGKGWVQQAENPAQALRPGDTVWIPPGLKHWHGAAATTAMTHIAFGERLDGVSVAWMERVSDADYAAAGR